MKKEILSGASPFSIFCHSGDHHFQNFLIFNKPFRRRRRPRPVYCSQPEHEAFWQRPGVTAGQSASQTLPTSQLRRPHFTLEPAPEPRIFTLELLQSPEPPIFHFAVAHTYQNVGRVPLPGTPPGTPPCPPATHTTFWGLSAGCYISFYYHLPILAGKVQIYNNKKHKFDQIFLLVPKRKRSYFLVLKVICPLYTLNLSNLGNCYSLVFHWTACPNLTSPGQSGKCLCNTLFIWLIYIIPYTLPKCNKTCATFYIYIFFFFF